MRIGIGTAVFTLCLLAFVVGGRVAPVVSSKLFAFQFVPTVLNAVGGASGLALLGIVGWVLLTALLGRFYCACLCPLGILQDLIRVLGRSVPWLRRRQDRQPAGAASGARAVLRYSVLSSVLVCAVLGSLFLLNLIAPYSAFGRIATDVLRPVAELVRRGLALVCEKREIFVFSAPIVQPFSALVFAVTVGLLTALAVMALLRGRLFCNSLCPVGTLLGLVARFSVFRIRVNAETCTGCGLCARRCRADCIRLDDSTRAAVDVSSCVTCFDCLSVCPVNSLSYAAPRRGLDAERTAAQTAERAATRRDFVLMGTASAACVAAIPLRGVTAAGMLPTAPGPVTPPGSGGVERFTSRCTGCHLCVTACPTGVIRPALLAYGLRGVMQPRLSYADGYCEYDCKTCSEVCPTGAIGRVSLRDKQLTQIGVATLHKDRCVVYLRGEECGACAEVCPTHAVYTEEREGIMCPEMQQELCIGCGACENVCPQRPRAIVVTAKTRHGRALEPFASDGNPGGAPPAAEQSGEGFPF